jgi:hypothetical protein
MLCARGDRARRGRARRVARVRVGTALASLRRVVVVPRLINPNASGYSDGGATQVPYTMKDSCPAIAVVPDQFYVR